MNSLSSKDPGIFNATVDGGADTCLDEDGHIFLEYTEKIANVVGFDDNCTKTNLHIGTSVTVVTTSDGNDILLLKNESIDHTSQPNSMLNVNQVRAHGVDIDDCPSIYTIPGRQGRQSMIVGEEDDGHEVIVPFSYTNNLVTYPVRKPSEYELENLPVYILTSDQPWDPTAQSDNDYLLSHVTSLEGRFINPTQTRAHATLSRRLNKSQQKTILQCSHGMSISPSKWLKLQKLINQSPNNTTIHQIPPTTTSTLVSSINSAWKYDDDEVLEEILSTCHELRSRGVPVDTTQLLRNMFIKDELTAEKTIASTTQLGKHIVRLPQRSHLKTRYPQLNCRRLTEKYSTDTWLAGVKVIDGESCVQMYYGVESTFTDCYGMTRESEGPSTLLKFIKETGAPFILKNDCAKMETSKTWTKILDQYNIRAELSEPYQQQQNQVERRI